MSLVIMLLKGSISRIVIVRVDVGLKQDFWWKNQREGWQSPTMHVAGKIMVV